MKDVQLALRVAYLDKLSDIEDVPVYDSFAPNVAPGTYILITNQTDNSDNPKGAFQTIAAITVDIVTTYPKGSGGKKRSEEIGNEVLGLILPASLADYPDMVPDFKIVNSSKLNSISLTEDYETEWVFRKIITFRHTIVQLTND